MVAVRGANTYQSVLPNLRTAVRSWEIHTPHWENHYPIEGTLTSGPRPRDAAPLDSALIFRRLWPPEYCPMGLKGQRTFQHACNIHLGHRRAASARATPSSWESDSGARSAYCFSQGKGELSSCTEIGDSPAPMPTHSALSIALPPYPPASQISPSPL